MSRRPAGPPLVHVIRWRVVAVRQPFLENFLLRRAQFESPINLHRGHSLFDEAILVAADERVAQRLRVAMGLMPFELGDFRRIRAQVRLFNPLISRISVHDRQEHIHVDVGTMILRAPSDETAKYLSRDLFLRSHQQENHRRLSFSGVAFRFAAMSITARSLTVIHRAVVNFVALMGADPECQCARKALRIRFSMRDPNPELATQIRRFHFFASTVHRPSVKPPAQSAAAACDPCRAPRFRERVPIRNSFPRRRMKSPELLPGVSLNFRRPNPLKGDCGSGNPRPGCHLKPGS